jgi:hypothetical protein
MEKIMINEKEASERYGYSIHWFRKKRKDKGGPNFYKTFRKIMYPLQETDEYFKRQI